MIKITLLYPNTPETKFDSEYYVKSHIPMVTKTCGDALKHVEVDLGIGSRKPGTAAPFVAIAHLVFESIEAYEKSFVANAAKFTADVPNYSNSRPQFQISEMADIELS